jgi:hypothetical protein
MQEGTERTMAGPGNILSGSALPQILVSCRARAAVVVFFLLLAIVFPVAAGGPEQNLTPDSRDNPARQEATGQTPALTLPAIVPDDTPGFFTRRYTFPFQQENITIRTNISAAVYYGAKNGDKYAIIPPGKSPEEMAPAYYRAFISDPAQDLLYADLLGSFRSLRQEHRYTDDEYAELLTVFVQSLPYDNTSADRPDTLSRFPAETLVDGTGDCDDKSVLLAGLLSREGYNVSLLLFIPEHHMAVGIGSSCLQYNDTGYAYVETTGVSFVGDVPKRLNQSEKYSAEGREPAPVHLSSVPVVIRAGSGSGNYSGSGETAYILAQKKEIDLKIASLKDQINSISRENPLRLPALLEKYNAYAGVHNFIAQHRNDRKGTYQYLRSVMPSGHLEPVSCVYRPAAIPAPAAAGTPAGGCISPLSPASGPANAGYLPCPRGLRVSRQCIWQSVRQELTVSSC